MDNTVSQTSRPREPWNKGKLVGQKAPFKLREIWAIRVWLQLEHRTRELALFDLGLDSKLRSCDLVKLRVRDICHGDRVAARATVMQQKTSRPVQFEITEQTRTAVADWMKMRNLHSEDYLFPSRAPRIASIEVLPDEFVASSEMLPTIAHATMPTPLLWRDYGYQDDSGGAGRTYQRSP